MNGKESYKAGIKCWLADDRPLAIASFREGVKSADQRYRYLCQGFIHYLAAPREESLLAALQEFADAELLGFLDFSMLFAVGHISWQLADKFGVSDEAGRAVLLQLAQRSFHAVQVEMPKPLLQLIERQYAISAGYLAEQLEYNLDCMRRRSVKVAALLDKLAYPECDLSALAEELGLERDSGEFGLVDRLLVACAYMSRRVLLGQPTDLMQVLAGT